MTNEAATSAADAGLFVVTELLGGGTLQRVLMDQMTRPHYRTYNDATALRWCHQLARGLRYLHNSRPMIIHRDLKPENVLLTGESSLASRNAKLADFGLHVRIRRELNSAVLGTHHGDDDLLQCERTTSSITTYDSCAVVDSC